MPIPIQHLPTGYIAIAFRRPKVGEMYLTSFFSTIDKTEQSHVRTCLSEIPGDISQVIVAWAPQVETDQVDPYIVGQDFES